MKQRCRKDKQDETYRNYAGRGIDVCKKWRESFAAFLADVGPRPSPELTLDRINNDGDYEPGNVRWATRIEQNNNTRSTPEDRRRLGRLNAMKRWHPDPHS